LVPDPARSTVNGVLRTDSLRPCRTAHAPEPHPPGDAASAPGPAAGAPLGTLRHGTPEISFMSRPSEEATDRVVSDRVGAGRSAAADHGGSASSRRLIHCAAPAAEISIHEPSKITNAHWCTAHPAKASTSEPSAFRSR